MNVLSIRAAKYFVTFMDEVSYQLRDFHMMEKGKSSEMLKHHVCWAKRRSGRSVKKVVLDGREK